MMRHFFVLVRSVVCGLCATAALACIGCGSADDNLELVPVTGKVTYQGRPLAGAKLMFIPTDKEMAERPAAEVDAEGAYELLCNEQAGAPPGKYEVVVMAFKPVVETDPNYDSEARPPSLIPEKYNNPKTSGFTAVVKEEGANDFNFKLD